jgi:hypothetical protein
MPNSAAVGEEIGAGRRGTFEPCCGTDGATLAECAFCIASILLGSKSKRLPGDADAEFGTADEVDGTGEAAPRPAD